MKVTGRSWTVDEAVDGVFFVVAGGLAVWLGWLIVASNPGFSLHTALAVIVFWALIAYVGLPRLQQLLAKIYVPDYFVGRTVTDTGILGDPVNLALEGSPEQLHAAMTQAGWVRADPVNLRSSWGIIVSTVLRRPYPSAPVSPLFLFGRSEAFAYQQEVDGNAAQRHHVRFWPTPEGWRLPGGHRVGWLAAGTYDRSVGLSLFTLQVTHKIDADIDRERDYIVGSVADAVPAAQVQVLEHVFSAFRSRNGGGDVVHTDGDLRVIDLSALPEPAGASPVSQDEALEIARRPLPPLMLMVAGIFSAGKALLTLLGLVLLAAGAARADLVPEATSSELVMTGLGAAGTALLWLLTLNRHRWARTLLMIVCSSEAIGQLSSASGHLSQQDSSVALTSAAVAVIVLIAVSSDGARGWVRGRS